MLVIQTCHECQWSVDVAVTVVVAAVQNGVLHIKRQPWRTTAILQQPRPQASNAFVNANHDTRRLHLDVAECDECVQLQVECVFHKH